MRLPFQPEPHEQLRSRFDAALEEIYDVESVNLGVAPAASSQRRNVFDCESGLRLMVSRERYPQGQLKMHISASVEPESELMSKIVADLMKDKADAVDPMTSEAPWFQEFCQHIGQQLLQISPRSYELQLMVVTDDLIPHFFATEIENVQRYKDEHA